VKYLLTSADIYYGLSPKEVRRLAYEFAVELKVEHIPESWSKNKQAGPHWFTAFIKRHQELSIRKPQHTSLARATAFNRTTVAEFFKKLFILLPTPKISNFCVVQSLVSVIQICSLITRNCIPSFVVLMQFFLFEWFVSYPLAHSIPWPTSPRRVVRISLDYLRRHQFARSPIWYFHQNKLIFIWKKRIEIARKPMV